jgi:hypothetical protein
MARACGHGDCDDLGRHKLLQKNPKRLAGSLVLLPAGKEEINEC